MQIFLLIFRMEAQQCDDVVVAKIDEKKLKKQTINVKTVSSSFQWIIFVKE